MLKLLCRSILDIIIVIYYNFSNLKHDFAEMRWTLSNYHFSKYSKMWLSECTYMWDGCSSRMVEKVKIRSVLKFGDSDQLRDCSLRIIAFWVCFHKACHETWPSRSSLGIFLFFVLLCAAIDCAWFVAQTLQCFAHFPFLVIPFIALDFIPFVSSDGMASIHLGWASWGLIEILLVALLSR